MSLFNFRKSKRKSSGSWQDTIINSAIAILSLMIFAFIFSFSRQYPRSGVAMPVNLPEPQEPRKLAVEIYQQNPIQNFTVEILNGCGDKGIAGKLSDFMRSHRMDVVRAENADNFDYTQTMIIQKNENVSALESTASALGFDVHDRNRVLIKPDPASDVDLTIIIGRDYASLPALKPVLIP